MTSRSRPNRDGTGPTSTRRPVRSRHGNFLAPEPRDPAASVRRKAHVRGLQTGAAGRRALEGVPVRARPGSHQPAIRDPADRGRVPAAAPRHHRRAAHARPRRADRPLRTARRPLRLGHRDRSAHPGRRDRLPPQRPLLTGQGKRRLGPAQPPPDPPARGRNGSRRSPRQRARHAPARIARFRDLEGALRTLNSRAHLGAHDRTALDRYLRDALHTVMRGPYDWAPRSARYDTGPQ